MRDLLLLSTSTVHGGGYLEYCRQEILSFLAGRDSILFVPYARPSGATHAEYTERTREKFAQLEVRVRGIDEVRDPIAAVGEAEAIFIGGGNTFVLLKKLYDENLLHVIRKRVLGGLPYMGSSAGSNVAGMTIGTTNDMPIVHPPSTDALGLLPLNLNPHYLDPLPGSTHMGETRETRIREFHHFNDQPVLALREGAMLRVQGDEARLLGRSGGRLFRRETEPLEVAEDGDVSFLLQA
jgi:dipeptidase E